METEEFERLKAVCEKEGFELLNETLEDNKKFFVVKKKKDEWDGVEFAECVKSSVTRFTEGKIYKVNPKGNGVDLCDFLIDNDYYPNGFVGSNREYFKPSTKATYVEQLKKECFERFGEINEGDRFKRDFDISIDEICTIGECKNTLEFKYFKSNDSLEFCGSIIYQSGKWATRVKERAEVLPLSTTTDRGDYKTTVSFTFSTNNRNYSLNGASTFLASHLEAYLNLKECETAINGEIVSIHIKPKKGADLSKVVEKAKELAKLCTE